MSIRTAIGALLLALGLTSASAAERSPGWLADCLTPVDPYLHRILGRYREEVRSRVEHEFHTFIQMLILPSFEGQYSVCLHGTPDDFWLEDAKQVTVSYYVADTSIWYAMPEHNEEKKQKEVKVTVSSAPMPMPLAKKIHAAWRRMLLRTRYVEDNRIKLDGTMAEFSVAIRGQGSYYGETSAPAEGRSPAYLFEIGHLLIRYCKAAPAERPSVAKVGSAARLVAGQQSGREAWGC